MQSIDGLPTHVLAIHAPIVFMPLVLLLSLVFAAKPDWRRRTGPLLAGAAAVAFISTVMAVLTGLSFDELIGDRVDTSDHERLAMTTMVLAGLLLVAAAVLFVVDRRTQGRLATGVMSVVVLLAVAATWWMIMTGDEGARLVWGNVIDATQSLRTRE